MYWIKNDHLLMLQGNELRVRIDNETRFAMSEVLRRVAHSASGSALSTDLVEELTSI
jgi:hypothetical protein